MQTNMRHVKKLEVPLIPDAICHEKSDYSLYQKGPPGKTNTKNSTKNAPDWTGAINSSKQANIIRDMRHYGGGTCSGLAPHPVLCAVFVSRAARVSGKANRTW